MTDDVLPSARYNRSYTRLKSPGRPSFPHKPDWFTSVLDPAVEHGPHSLTHFQTAQLTEAQGISQILSSRIVKRSIRPALTPCGISKLTGKCHKNLMDVTACPKLLGTNTNIHANSSHRVSFVPHGPSATLNGKIIIIAAVSSTCTTQKIFSLTDLSKKKTRVPLTTTQYSAQTSVHQHKSTRLTSSFFGASRSISSGKRQKYHHRRCFINVYHAKDFQSNRPFKEKNTSSPHHHTTLCPNFSSPTQKHSALIKFLWCLTVRQRRSTAKLSSSPLFHQRVLRKRFSV